MIKSRKRMSRNRRPGLMRARSRRKKQYRLIELDLVRMGESAAAATGSAGCVGCGGYCEEYLPLQWLSLRRPILRVSWGHDIHVGTE